MPSKHHLSVGIAHTHAQLNALRAEWNSLLAQSRNDTVFLTWEWQESWWRAFGGTLFVVLLRHRDELVAIFPFLRECKQGFDVLRWIGAPHSDYLNVIIRRGWEDRALGFFFAEFLARDRRVGVLELDSVPQTPEYVHVFMERLSPPGWRILRSRRLCPTIALPETWEAYLASLSPGMRRYIRRKERKLSSDFAVEITVASTAAELQNRMEQFFALHQKRQKQLGHRGSFTDSRSRCFHLDIASRLLRDDRLRLYCLALDGQPAAFYYLFRYRRSLLYYLSGIDPRFGHYSPGVVLLSRAVRDAITDGLEEFDLLRGEGAYKFKWTDTWRNNTSYLIHRDSARVRSYLHLQQLRAHISRLRKAAVPNKLKSALQRIGNGR